MGLEKKNILLRATTYEKVGVLMDQASPSPTWARPALGLAWASSFSSRAGPGHKIRAR